jgi:hypothetical protein
VWDFERQWRGYREIDLGTGKATKIPMADVVRRFRQAVDAGKAFPFLHPLTYRTFGWRWDFDPRSPAGRPSPDHLSNVVEGLLERFIAGNLECSLRDLTVTFSRPSHALAVFDATPGGNGLSQALLADSRMSNALNECRGTLSRFDSRGGNKRFTEYVAHLLNVRLVCTLGEVTDAIDTLRKRWQG